jgi:hypothetical protein
VRALCVLRIRQGAKKIRRHFDHTGRLADQRQGRAIQTRFRQAVGSLPRVTQEGSALLRLGIPVSWLRPTGWTMGRLSRVFQLDAAPLPGNACRSSRQRRPGGGGFSASSNLDRNNPSPRAAPHANGLKVMAPALRCASRHSRIAGDPEGPTGHVRSFPTPAPPAGGARAPRCRAGSLRAWSLDAESRFCLVEGPDRHAHFGIVTKCWAVACTESIRYQPPFARAVAGFTFARRQEAVGRSWFAGGKATALCKRMREVDALITPVLQNRVRETHPELVFALWNRGPMAHHKSKPKGRQERLNVLARRGISFDPAEGALLAGSPARRSR